jgi:hypothetical protein
MRSVPRCYGKDDWLVSLNPMPGGITGLLSTYLLRGLSPQANFLGEINIGIKPTRLGESQK